jgi:two-component system LytT family response regulator
MVINCIAIDDEPLALLKLEGFIAKVPELKLIKTFESAIDAIGWLKLNKTDLVFLDIQMAHLTGIQFLETNILQAKVIITSAYDKYAIKGFDLNVADYLLKPYHFKRFVMAVSKVIDSCYGNLNEQTITNANDSCIFVKTEYRLERVDFNSILYIEGMKDYLRIVCNDKKLMTLQSFGQIENLLPSKRFCRVHKSYIVAIDKIESIERAIIKIGDKRIPVSDSYRENFFRILKK